MFEKVNPTHPDKVADRIAGALVDIAYANQENPKVAAEVLIGHGLCTIIVESSYEFTKENVLPVVQRIAGKNTKLKLISVPQDPHRSGSCLGAADHHDQRSGGRGSVLRPGHGGADRSVSSCLNRIKPPIQKMLPL